MYVALPFYATAAWTPTTLPPMPAHAAPRHVRGRSASAALAVAMKAADYLADIPQGAPDAILGIAQAFRASEAGNKVNVAVGAYRDDVGVPYVLPSVREAEQRLLARGEKKEYAPIEGLTDFRQKALEFAYGEDCAALKEGRIAGVQTLSGTGACRVAGEFYARFLPEGTAVYVSDPTWGNHIPIMELAGLEVRKYRYLDRKTNGLDYEAFLEDIDAAPAGSVFLLHACAHNPTGVDPTRDQWDAVSKKILAKGHHVLMDCAYQGFASGDAEADAVALRSFVEDGHQILLCQSYAKNFGLYGERVGALSAVCASKEEKAALESQLKAIIRPMYSSPPIHGARIVKEVLGDAALRAQWTGECKEMAARIQDMRALLREGLAEAGSTRDWSHITDQIGMFAYTGLSKEQVQQMRDESAVYCTLDGRISVAGLNRDNVAYVAAAIHAVSK